MLLLLAGAAAQAQSPAEEEFFSKIFTAMGIATGSMVADIGTGSDPVHARRMSKIVGQTGKIVCVDINDKVIAHLQGLFKEEGLANIEAHLGKPNDPVLPTEAFDAILVSSTYHEMEEHQAMLEHIRQALKPGGRLVVIELIAEKRRNAPRLEQTLAHEFAPDLLDAELRAGGFKIIRRIEPLATAPGEIKYLILATPNDKEKP
jgi:ubiquinone/menaquinone biosynthesis C-methylase UbiE